MVMVVGMGAGTSLAKAADSEYDIEDYSAEVGVYQLNEDSETNRCYGTCYENSNKIYVEISNVRVAGALINTDELENIIYKVNLTNYETKVNCEITQADFHNGVAECAFTYTNPTSEDGKKKNIVVTMRDTDSKKQKTILDKYIQIFDNCPDLAKCLEENIESGGYDLCMQIPEENVETKTRCLNCFTSSGIWTAVGCIPQAPEKIITTILEIGLSVGGAVVIIMILIGSFMLSASQGDPKKTQEAKEMITSAIIGLLFIIFSITILQFIGVSIIKIPGFGM